MGIALHEETQDEALAAEELEEGPRQRTRSMVEGDLGLSKSQSHSKYKLALMSIQ
jgi:hypothetical protein